MEQNENPQTEQQTADQRQERTSNAPQPPKPQPQPRKTNIGLKILLIAGLSLAMLIPRLFIGMLIDGREDSAKEARRDVFASWGYEQKIMGPVLYIPHDENINLVEGESSAIYIVPEDYNFSGNLTSEKLHRGIYDVVVYKSTADISGSFVLPEDLKNINWAHYKVASSKIYIDFGSSKIPNFTDKLSLTIGSNTMDMKYDSQLGAMACTFDATPLVTGQTVSFKTNIGQKGSSMYSVAPVGNTSTIHIESDYPSPSFRGACLPDTREIKSDGFTADWKIVRNIPLNCSSAPTMTSFLYGYDDEIFEEYDDETGNKIKSINVEMNMPVDQYTQNDRAIKYSFLIVVLTFITVFVVENRKRTPIHWVQYLLIGFAIMVFYTLLLSFSEYIAFGWSYLIASIMTIGLITAYMAGILKVHKTAYSVGIILAVLYAFIYVLLSLETMSLLIGSLGLFVILAVIMFASLKINWNGGNR